MTQMKRVRRIGLPTVAGLLVTTALAAGLAFAAPARAAAPESAATDHLRHLPMPQNGWTFTGERSRVDFNIFLAPGETNQSAEFVLTLESSVEVMPEVSALEAAINGRTIGSIGLGADRNGKATAITIAPSLLKGGWNRISLVATQRHRVDCTVNGTYELWSRIDPARTGLTLGKGRATGLLSLASQSADETGAMPLRLRVPPRSDSDLTTALTTAALIARMTAASTPKVDVASPAGTGDGIDIAIGTDQELAALGLSPAVIAAAASGPQFLPADDSRRATLVMTKDGIARRGNGIDRLFDLAGQVGVPHTLLMRADHSPTSISLAQFGEPSNSFSGRLWQSTMHIGLPSDALIADYGSVTLRLSSGYAAGLDPDSNLSLFVGGRLAATVPFGSSSGGLIDDHRISIPLSAFQPGDNEVQLVAKVTSPTDATCSPQDQMDGRARFLILNSSSFDLPELASAGRLPDLRATLGNGQDHVIGSEPIRLALTDTDAETIGAAATLYAKMAAVATELPKLDATFTLPVQPTEATIVLGNGANLPAAFKAEAGLDLDRMHGAPVRPALADASLFDGDLPTGALPATAAGDDPLLDEWRKRVGEPKSSWTSLSGFVNNMADEIEAALGLADTAPRSFGANAALVVTQSTLAGGAPLTLVTAPDGKALSDGVASLVEPANWQRLDGESLVLDGQTGSWTVEAARHPRIVFTGDYGVGNLRLMLAAWFALNTPIYAGLLTLAALIFGIMTYATVRRHGARTIG